MIGCQAQRSTPEALAFAARSHVVKGVNQTDVLRAAPDDAIRIYRWVFGNQDLANPASIALGIVSTLAGYRHPNLYVETLNELPKNSLHDYIAFLKAIVPILHARGLKVCGPSWATGDYDKVDWNAFRAANWCGLDAIALHAYWADRGPTIYNGLRWRTYYNAILDGHRLVVITECGRDTIRDGDNGTYIGRGGWKADGLSADTYAAELNAYGAQLLPHELATPFISGAEPNWNNYDLDELSASLHTGGPPVTPPTYSSPNHGGARATTTGVVIHATLGNSTNPLTEYHATLNWFYSPASQVSAHAVVGPVGLVDYPVDLANEAWHCRASNATHLGIEMCKAHVDNPILPEILDAAAQIVARWCKQYAIPIVWSTTHGIEEHRNMPSNTDGHQDVGGPFDRADFLARVKRYAGGDELTNEQKAKVLDDLGLIWGMAKADTIKANPAESERAIHERVASIKIALGING